MNKAINTKVDDKKKEQLKEKIKRNEYKMSVPNNISDLTNIPYQFIISFIIGYIGYWIAYQGYETSSNNKNYKILIFALPSLFTSYMLKLQNIESLWKIISLFLILFGSTIIFGIFWRKWGIKFLEWVLYEVKISNANGYKITQDIGKEMENGLPVGKLIVRLNNGTKLVSYFDNEKHKDKPIGRFKIDDDGNILMYVDETNDEVEEIDPKEIMITYIPKESIRCFDLIASKNQKVIKN